MRSGARPSAAAAAAKPPTKATSSAPSRRSRPGSSPAWTSRSALGDARREGAGRGAARAVGAAIGVRRRGEIGGADRRARSRARADVLDAGAVGAGRGAEDARERRRILAAARRTAASGFSVVGSSRAATARTAASISAICAGNRSRNRPEMRQVTSTRGRPIAAGGSTSMPVTRPVACVPGRPAAHQREAVRDLLAAGAQRRAAPEIDDERARHLAMRLQVAADHLVGREPAEVHGGRRRQRARIGGEEIAAGRQHVARARAPARRPGPARRAGRRARRAARSARPRRSPASDGSASVAGARP